jgi:hypothetical protein
VCDVVVHVRASGVFLIATVTVSYCCVFRLLGTSALNISLENERGEDYYPAAAFADEHLECLENGLLEGLWVGSVAVGYTLHVLRRSSVAILYFPYWRTRTWYLVSNVLQTPVSNIIATRNGMKPLVDMMAVDFEGRTAPVGKGEFYRGARRYMLLSLVWRQRRGGGDGCDRRES